MDDRKYPSPTREVSFYLVSIAVLIYFFVLIYLIVTSH